MLLSMLTNLNETVIVSVQYSACMQLKLILVEVMKTVSNDSKLCYVVAKHCLGYSIGHILYLLIPYILQTDTHTQTHIHYTP